MTRLRLLTYNIHAGRGWDIRRRTEARPRNIAAVADVIRSADPDIATLQEVDIDQGAELAQLLGMELLAIASITGGDRRDYGIATLTRIPIARSREVWLPGHERARCALLTQHAWAGGELAVVNAHLSMLFRDRPGQVAALVDELGDEPLVIAGDFNMTPFSPAYRALKRGFTSATRFARTWPAPAALVPIDHVRVRGPLHVVRGGAWTDAGARRASDHLPVVAEIELRL